MSHYRALKKFAIVLIVIGCLVAAYIFIGSQFRFGNIRDDSLAEQEVLVDSIDESVLRQVLEQPYTYLDRGRQSYVFESKDGHYVIKFFDLGRYRHEVLTFLDSIKRTYSPWKFKDWVNQARMKRKMTRLFSGYKLAYERDREHSFIIFQQLLPNPLLNHSVEVSDRFGFKHQIDLSKVPFVIQSKAVPTRVVMTELLEQGNVAEAKWHLRMLLDMYMTEYKQGIYDRDHNFMYNTGFVNGKPMRLDVGRLRSEEQYKEKKLALKDLEKIAIDRTEGWMQRHFPKYKEEILADMHIKLRELQLQN